MATAKNVSTENKINIVTNTENNVTVTQPSIQAVEITTGPQGKKGEREACVGVKREGGATKKGTEKERIRIKRNGIEGKVSGQGEERRNARS